MNTPELKNGSGAAVALVPEMAADGAVVLVVVIKQQWVISEDNLLSESGSAAIEYADELRDPEDPDHSSIVKPSDMCQHKPFTDVVVIGAAVEYGATPVRELDVYLRVGPVERSLRVFGPRVWYQGVTGMVPTPPELFESQPIIWEDAFGGFDQDDPNAAPLEEARNPIGRGIKRRSDALAHQPCPSIEDPRDLISTHRSRPAPAGLAPIGRQWQPRRQYTGTFDKTWMETRMPLPPLDADPRHHQIAPPELIVPGYLRGGELVQIHHMNAAGPMQFELPKVRYFVGAQVDGQLIESAPVLDTVLLRPTERTLDLTYRTLLKMPRPAHRMSFVQVHEKEWL